MLENTNSLSANHMAETHFIQACRCAEDNFLRFKASIRRGKKEDIRDSGCGEHGCRRPDGLVYWEFNAQPSLGLQRMVLKRANIESVSVVWRKMSCWCQRSEVRRGREVGEVRKATLT